MNGGRCSFLRFVTLICVAAMALPSVGEAASRKDRGIEKRMRHHIEVLASDEYEGREPGTPGEAKTLKYLGREWYKLGLVSGTNDPGNEWFVPVTLVAREPATSTAQFRRRGRRVSVPEAETLMLTSGKRSLVRDAPLLFVGNGEGLDLTRTELAGRVAVILDAGVEGSERQNALLVAGASGVLTVLDADRTLEQVSARRERTGYALANDPLGGDLEGFITRAGMNRLLRRTRYSLKGLEGVSKRRNFSPRRLGITASLEATTRETTIQTHNMIGMIPGKKPGTGAVLFVAHWDHFGLCGEQSVEDPICNGAIDNASGLAALTEIARQLAKGRKLDRDVYFLATTAEEFGLLGAHAFAENPPLPLTQIVAAFNIDSIALAPSGTPLGIVGRGMTGLDKTIAEVAMEQGREIIGSDDANAFVRRQDGWALLQHDIPTVMVTSAYGDIERVRRFFETHYHRPSDDLALELELGGAVEDVNFHVALARRFANTAQFVPSEP